MDFSAFRFSGFRSFTGGKSSISLAQPITLILGGNNSGKSSVVSLLTKLPDIVRAVSRNVVGSTILTDLDKPRLSDENLQLTLPIEVGGFLDNAPTLRSRVLDALRRGDVLEMVGSDYYLSIELPWTSKDLIPLPLSDDLCSNLATIDRTVWSETTSALNLVQSSDISADIRNVHKSLLGRLVLPPPFELVPPGRELRRAERGTAGVSEWSPDGKGIISRLDEIRNPDWNGYRERELYAAICDAVGQLLDKPMFDYSLPAGGELTIGMDGQFYPLSSVGTGTAHAIMIVFTSILTENGFLILEEPDAHLHPRLQRKLIRVLRERAQDGTGAQLVVTTHSAHMIDEVMDSVIVVSEANGVSNAKVVGTRELFDQLGALGYRASDLLQANCVIWVEGPSDRIYLNYWLKVVGSSYVEGVNYSIMFYGGSLLDQLHADLDRSKDANEDDVLVDLYRINQNLFLVGDSDRKDPSDPLKPRLERLQREITISGRGGIWITEGYTIENHVDVDVLSAAVKTVHTSVDRIGNVGYLVDPLSNLIKRDGTVLRRPDKVAIAREVVELQPEMDRYLVAEVTKILQFIDMCNQHD